MVDYILEIESISQEEFTKKFKGNPLFWKETKHKLFVAYANFLNSDLTKDLIINQLLFKELKVREGYPKLFELDETIIVNDEKGFRIGYWRVKKVCDLISYQLNIDFYKSTLEFREENNK